MATSVFLAACGGGMNASGTPDRLRAMTPAGFLPQPTPRPLETPPAGARGPAANCPPVLLMSCVHRGDAINLYRDLQLGRVDKIEYESYGEAHSVIDAGSVSDILKTLDLDVIAQTADLRGVIFDRPFSDSGYLYLSWPGDITPTPLERFGTRNSVTFYLNPGLRTVIDFDHPVQFVIPGAFVDLLTQRWSAASRTPISYPSPMASLPVPDSLRFESSIAELTWDGPDQRVRSSAPGDHCSPGESPAGVPHEFDIEVSGDDGRTYIRRFFVGSAVLAEGDWRWIGYQHGEWQLWQGDDAFVFYLVPVSAAGIAFRYYERLLPCI